jgi:iron complex outermembrane receptor protein
MRVSIAVAVAFLTLGGISAANEANASIKKQTNIPAQGLGAALQTLAQERQLQVVYLSDAVDSLNTTGAVGEFTADEALTKLLSGTGLTYRYLDSNTITVQPLPSRGERDAPAKREGEASVDSSPGTGGGGAHPSEGEGNNAKEAQTSFWDRFRLAQADQGTSSNSSTVDKDTQSSNKNSGNRIALEEVLVTATKREESAQVIPMSISVINNQEIERRGLIGMEDYLRSVPGVNQIDVGPKSNAIVIRGITTSPQAENFGSGATVASYFDETPITAAAGLGQGGIDVRPVDIERIEILRGPQGTAFGSASLGGTMRMIPVKPKLDGFSAKLAAAYSDTSGSGSGNSMIQGVVNIPVVADKFALRAVGYRYLESGFYRNIAGADPATIAIAEPYGLGDFVRGHVQDDVGQIVSTGGRLAALWQATDKLDLSMNFLTQKIEQDGAPESTVGRYEQTRLPIASQARVRGEAGEVADTHMDLVNLVLNYDLGWAALTSAASWVDSDSAYASDLSRVFPFPASTTQPSDFKSFTAETRLASKLEGPFQFLGGLYYENLDDSSSQTLDWPGTPATNPLPLVFGAPASDPMALFHWTRQLDQRAVFGEASYNLTDKLTATVGMRYFKYEKNERSLQEGGLFGVPLGAGVPVNLDSSEGRSNFKANLSYKPTQDSLLYASWAQGFRLGRPSAGLLPSTCDTNGDGLVDGTSVSIESTRRIDSDFLDNYELGGKFTLFDRRMVVDTAVYHIKWDGLPVNTFAAACNLTYTANAGGATSDGVEFQASFFVVEGLRLDFGGGYTKAELSQDAPVQGWHEGDRLPGSPKVSANLAAQYDFDVAGHKAFIRADSFYTGKFYGDLLETPALAAGDYIKVDARAGVAISNLSVELFVRNLTNEDAFTWRGTSTFPSVLGYRLRPRTVGIQLGYSFE